MKKKEVFVIQNNLEDYREIFEMIKKKAPFNVHLIDFTTLQTEKNIKLLKSLETTEIMIVLHCEYWESIKNEYTAFLKSLYDIPFSNTMYICEDCKCYEDMDILSGQKMAFFFNKSHNSEEQTVHFILYLISQFKNVVQSHRLADYICNSFEEVVYAELLKAKKKEIDKLYHELEVRSKTDYLTNLYNRAAIFEFLNFEKGRTLRDLWRLENDTILIGREKTKTPVVNYSHKPAGSILNHLGKFTLMLIDLDHFKQVNDNHGHLAGDEVLKALGKLLLGKEILRENDIAGRFGGEEFLVILPETNAKNAFNAAKRLSRKFSKISFKGAKDDKEFHVTLSIGISEFHPNDKKCEEIIHRADLALYYSKEHGRNRITVYEKIAR